MLGEERLCDSGDKALCPVVRGIDESASQLQGQNDALYSKSCSPSRHYVHIKTVLVYS